MDIADILKKHIPARDNPVYIHKIFKISRKDLHTKDRNIMYFKDDNGKVHFVKFTKSFSNLQEIDIDDVCDSIIGKRWCRVDVTYVLCDNIYISGYKTVDEPKYTLVWLKIRKRINVNTDL